MTTSRFLRSPVRTVTITGTTSVGGGVTTTIGIYPDGTIRFTDRAGQTVVAQGFPTYTTTTNNIPQPGAKLGWKDDEDKVLFRLVDALIARA